MHLFWRTSFRHIRVTNSGIKKTARKVEKVFESHDRLCRFETCFLGVGSLDDNEVTKFREVVSHGSVESDFALLDQFQGSQLERSGSDDQYRSVPESHGMRRLTEVISLVWLQIHITLSGPTSPLEGSPTTLGPPPLKYISSSRFVTPYTKPGIFFAAKTWVYN